MAQLTFKQAKFIFRFQIDRAKGRMSPRLAVTSFTERQGFLNVFFFLFLDERNNRVRVTNCQSPLSATQFFDLCIQRQLSDRPPGHGGPNFPFLELVTCTRRDPPQARKTCRPLRPRNCQRFCVLCALLSAKYAFIVIFIYDILLYTCQNFDVCTCRTL